MIAAALCGALTGAVAGCLALFGVRAWQRRRRELPMWAQHSWTGTPDARRKH